MEIKKYLKKLLLLLFIFFLAGCDTDYTLSLNEDSSVSEKVVINIENTEDNYNKVLELINKYPKEKKDYKVIRQDDNLNITYNKNYMNIDSYLSKSYMYRQLIDNVDITKKNHKIKLNTSLETSKNILSVNKDSMYDITNLKINIDSKLPVLNNNSDVNNNGIYTWNIDDNTIAKNIDLTYKTIPAIVTIRSLSVILLIVLSTLILGIVIYKRMGVVQRL